METRRYRNSDDFISLLGFGCMRFPMLEDGRTIDRNLVRQLVEYAIAHGVNYFDTAYLYNDGESERCIGRILKDYPRHSFYLADKMAGRLVKSIADGDRMFREQLERCGVDYFDFYLCHAIGRTEVDFTEPYLRVGFFDYLLERKKEGVIRRLGFSFHGTPARLEFLLNQYDWDFVQLQLNYVDWEVQDARRLYRMLEERGIPCIVMEPVRGGSLSTLCPEAVELLRAARLERSAASWAIRYAASLPGVLTVLSGMNSFEQVRDNVAIMTGFTAMDAEEREALEQARTAYMQTGTIPCTGCRYCMDCPSGVDIPRLFALYNERAATLGLPVSTLGHYRFDRNARAFLEAYQALPEDIRAHNCVDCGQCREHCPQDIPVAEHLRNIEKLIAALRP